jgi:hypothetical protein
MERSIGISIITAYSTMLAGAWQSCHSAAAVWTHACTRRIKIMT